MVMVAQLCIDDTNHWIVRFKWANFMACELYLNKALQRSVYFSWLLKTEPQLPLPWSSYSRLNNLYPLSPHSLTYQSVILTDVCHFSGVPLFESISNFGENLAGAFATSHYRNGKQQVVAC